jgi:uncharacterized protein
MSKKIEDEINAWLESVVIGLQLCPFALKPIREARHRIFVSDADDLAVALADLQQECERLDEISVGALETTLLVLPKMMQDFYDFNDFLSIANDLLDDRGWQGIYQLASFHPRYQFAGTQQDDAENLTNASPYPVIHILREASVEQAVEAYDNVDSIPERNILRMNGLSQADKARLFDFLY